MFPNAESAIRLVGALLVETNDDMTASERRNMTAGAVTTLVIPRSTPKTFNCALLHSVTGHHLKGR